MLLAKLGAISFDIARTLLALGDVQRMSWTAPLSTRHMFRNSFIFMGQQFQSPGTTCNDRLWSAIQCKSDECWKVYTTFVRAYCMVTLNLGLKMGIVGSHPRPTVLFPTLAGLSVSQPLRTSSGVIDCRIPQWPVVPGVATRAASKGIRILVKPNSSQNDHWCTMSPWVCKRRAWPWKYCNWKHAKLMSTDLLGCFLKNSWWFIKKRTSKAIKAFIVYLSLEILACLLFTCLYQVKGTVVPALTVAALCVVVDAVVCSALLLLLVGDIVVYGCLCMMMILLFMMMSWWGLENHIKSGENDCLYLPNFSTTCIPKRFGSGLATGSGWPVGRTNQMHRPPRSGSLNQPDVAKLLASSTKFPASIQRRRRFWFVLWALLACSQKLACCTCTPCSALLFYRDFQNQTFSAHTSNWAQLSKNHHDPFRSPSFGIIPLESFRTTLDHCPVTNLSKAK